MWVETDLCRRKNRKSLPIQQHGRPWPPRRSDVLDDTQSPTGSSGTLPTDSIDTFHPRRIEKRDDQSKQPTRDDCMLPVGSHGSSKSNLGYQVCGLGAEKDIKAEHGTEFSSAMEEVSQKTSPNSLVFLEPPRMTTSSLPPALVVTKECFHGGARLTSASGL